MSNLSELLPSGGGQNQVEFVASGTLPNGKPVILKADGTVEVVGISATSTPVSKSIPVGSAVQFNAGATAYAKVAFDPNTPNKFVVAYADNGGGSNGRAVVGTVSGTSISFGSEITFVTGSATYVTIAFDPNTANKFVVAYYHPSSTYGFSRVGTVSGTSISFGTAAIFNWAVSTHCSISFDPNTANNFVIAYRDEGNSNYGTAIQGEIVENTSLQFGSEHVFNSANTDTIIVSFDTNTTGKFVVVYSDRGNSRHGTACVGTLSGTTLSFGSEVVFNAALTDFIGASFDPNTANRFVVTYDDEGNSGHGTAILGTVSGTSISFGSESVFSSSSYSFYTNMSFDPNTANKFVVVYKDYGNSSYGTACVGTISGTSISFGSESVFNSANTQPNGVAFAIDPTNAGKFVVTYPNASNYGRVILGQIASATTTQTTNLTSTNLIGIAAEAASSGATAKINTWGGINEAQSSLTIASDYYVQTDGTITTATGGQKVGQAISATTINMRNQP